MNIKVIGGVVAVVVVGGGVFANNYVNSEAVNTINKGIKSANERLSEDGAAISNGSVECSVLFSDTCVLNDVQFTNDSNESVKIGKLTVGGVKSLAKAYEQNGHGGILYGNTNVSVKMEQMTGPEDKTVAQLWQDENPDTYAALTDDIKKALEDNKLYFSANIDNKASTEQFVSDELFTVGLTDMPISGKFGFKYTYNGDIAQFADPEEFMQQQKNNIFGFMSNLIINNISLEVEQGDYTLTNIGHNLYKENMSACSDDATCIQARHKGLPEPYASQETVLTKDEFQKAMVKGVEEDGNRFHQKVAQAMAQFALTPEETKRILEFVVKGGGKLSINAANAKNTPLVGFGDVMMSQDPSILRDKLDITIK